MAVHGWASMPSKLALLDKDVNFADMGCERTHRRGSFEGGEDTGYRLAYMYKLNSGPVVYFREHLREVCNVRFRLLVIMVKTFI